MKAYLNRIATAVPPHDVHRKFVSYAPTLLSREKDRKLFARMAERSQIEHRYSFLPPHPSDEVMETENFYRTGDFPTTGERNAFYAGHAFALAKQALDELNLAENAQAVTHLIVTSCTGFYAPGLDIQIIKQYGLSPSIERSMIGFMGCYAAINALKLARHIVRSEPAAKVLIVNLELCTLHMHAEDSLEELLSFLIFADGCAASLVSAEPRGFELQHFHSALLPDSPDQITWKIGDQGFDMLLSGQVPVTVAKHLPSAMPLLLGEIQQQQVKHWAVHPGGRSILDAVQQSLGLDADALATSRSILRRYGNMSSPTVMFVLKEMLERSGPGIGCAMAFGPGIMFEALRFEKRE